MFKKTEVHQTYPEYYLIRTTKFTDLINDTLDEWIYFFKNSEVLDSFRAKGMEEVREKLKVMNMDDDERRRYEKYIERLSDEASYAETLKIEAEDRVREDERKKMAVAMLKMNFPSDQIIALTGFSEDEIEVFGKDM
jgi:predicted transposase/invertase (TIGR01784 family)